MNALRFKVGDLAIMAVIRHSRRSHLVGEVVEITEIGVTSWEGHEQDYAVLNPDGTYGAVQDWQLRKIDPPSEPASLTRVVEQEIEA